MSLDHLISCRLEFACFRRSLLNIAPRGERLCASNNAAAAKCAQRVNKYAAAFALWLQRKIILARCRVFSDKGSPIILVADKCQI